MNLFEGRVSHGISGELKGFSAVAVSILTRSFQAITGSGKIGEPYLSSKGAYYAVTMMREFFTGVNRLRGECREIGLSAPPRRVDTV